VRQGDALYNGDLYHQAGDFYVRLLQSEASHDDTMELQYKIGMCFLRQKLFARARSWMDAMLSEFSPSLCVISWSRW